VRLLDASSLAAGIRVAKEYTGGFNKGGESTTSKPMATLVEPRSKERSSSRVGEGTMRTNGCYGSTGLLDLSGVVARLFGVRGARYEGCVSVCTARTHARNTNTHLVRNSNFKPTNQCDQSVSTSIVLAARFCPPPPQEEGH
jgi:hypothetical protein